MKKVSALLLCYLTSFCISNAQSLVAVSPTSANSGQSLTVSITGSGTNFTQGSGTFSVWLNQTGFPNIYASSFTVITNTLIDANFSIPVNASTGWRNVNVNDDLDGTVAMTNGFFIQGSEITTVDPDTAQRGQSLSVSITGLNTNFLQGSGTFSVWLDLSGIDIYASSFNVISNTSLDANFSLPTNAATGFWDVKVSDDWDGTITKLNGFYIQPPQIVSVDPNVSARNVSSLSVAITGQYTKFTQGSGTFNVWLLNSTSIYASSFNPVNDTLINANFTIPAAATLGYWDVKVSDDYDGTVTLSNGFLIECVTLTTTASDASCYSSCDGSATVSVTGGTSPYTYLWNTSPVQTSSTATGLCAGTYIVTVTDATFCSNVDTAEVNEPEDITVSVSTVDATCNNGCDGTATATVIGGIAPYTYLWSTGGTANTETSLCAGTHTLTVTDANGCTDNSNYIIDEPSAISASFTVTDASCNGAYDGEATVHATGGTPPYTYDGLADSTFAGLCAASYSVQITDANGCSALLSYTVNEPSALVTSYTESEVSCYGGNDGYIDLSVTGGIPPYTYLWDDPSSQTTTSATGLSAGTYNVIVADGNNCTASDAVIITDPTVLSASTSSIDATCGGSDGEATAQAAGGTGSYAYLWDDPASQTTATATGLSAGTYTVIVADDNGCIDSAIATINDAGGPVASTSSTDVHCGNADGTATATVTGGTQPYTWQWDDPSSQTTMTATGLFAGTYNIIVTDAFGCQAAGSATVNDAGSPTAAITDSSNIACYGGSDGSATVTVSGGTPPYTYLWDDIGSQTTATATGLGAGTYTVTVSDANGCTDSYLVIITEPPTLSATTSSVDATCGGSDGEATAQAAGGTGSYAYLWDDPVSQTTPTATGLPAGTYNITVTDLNGCTTTANAIINDAGGPVASTSSADAHCGNADGSATVSTTGGTLPYTWQWDDPSSQTTATATGLLAGTYNVIVTDNLGCSAAGSATVNDAGSPTAAITDSSNIACYGGSDGSATVTVSGGTPPYTYLWDANAGNQTDSTATGLMAGSYTVTVTDVNGCTASNSVTLTVPPAITITMTGTDATCYGVNDATATATVSGGTGAYTYLWDDIGSQTTATATGLGAGTFTVTVSDTNGCTETDNITISEPPTALTTGITGFDETNCQANGMAILTVTGGIAPYTFSWSNGATTQSLNGLTVGTYIVTVTDSAGCMANDTVIIGGSVPPSTGITGYDENGCGTNDGIALLTVSGGTPPFTYSWSHGATTQNLSGLAAGTYTVAVTDSNGCITYNTVIIGQPESPTVSISGFNETACEANNGAAALVVYSGASPYTFNWSNGATTQNVTGLSPGTYLATVTDANGCTASDAITIAEAPGPAINNIVGIDENSCGASDGAAILTVSGGTTPFTYNWSNGATTQNITGLTAGTYSVTVTDANGCVTTGSVTLTELASLNLTTSSTTASCGMPDGSATVTANGGTAPYTYAWSSGDASAIADSLYSGIYIVTVTDATGCSNFAVATVSDQGGASVTISSITNVSCNGSSDGAINISVSGGITPYTYEWSNGNTSEDIGNISAGPYEVNVTDGNGCITSASITVTEPAAFSLIITTTDANCGSTDGDATVSVTGGTGSYTYAWSSGGNSTTENGLAAGVYVVTVTDANGCSGSATAAISNIGGPVITIDLIEEAGCGGEIGAIYISVTGGTTPYTYSWSDGSTSEDLVDVYAGDYDITVIDSSGCLATASIEVSGIPPVHESICLVTVDSTTGKNLIVWEKVQVDGVQSYNIYKESTQIGVYYLIGNVPYDSLSQFIDTLSNPLQRSWRYKIAVVDLCENVSEKSDDHKTMHLNINLGLGGNINLMWDHYKGFTVSSYYIYRYTTSTGWVALDSLPSNLTSYTDFSPPDDNLFYEIRVKHPDGCSATLKSKDYNSSKSNTSSISTTGTLTATIAHNNATQGNCDGSATLTASGGNPPYTYLWDDTYSQTTATADSLCAGSYNVLVTDANGNTTTASVTISEIIGIDGLQVAGCWLLVYPNPSRGEFSLVIDLNEKTNVLLEIYTMQGKLISAHQTGNILGTFSKRIDLSSYPAGIYHLQIVIDKGVVNKKIIIE
ncbi:MAG: T9SS type A sorting domain-containing protein [Bacteroidota bacterium]